MPRIELELSIDELVDVALGTTSAKGVDLNVDKDIGYAKHHASSLFSFLLENSLYYWC